MSAQVDILPDETRPEGGHAKVIMRGVTAEPSHLRICISAIPDDPDNPNSAVEWTLGDLKPLAAELTPEGLSLLLGPEIVDAPELQPGTPVLLSVPNSDIHVELSWPDLPVSLPEKLPSPIIDAADLRAKKLEHRKLEEQKKAEAEARLEATHARIMAPSAGSPKPPVGTPALSKPPAIPTTKGEPSSRRGRVDLPDLNLATDTHKAPKVRAANMRQRAETAPVMPALLSDASPMQRAGPPPSKLQRAPSARRDGTTNWLSVILAVIALPLIVLAIWPSIMTKTLEPAATAAVKSLTQQADWLTSILAVGQLSPSGVDASAVSAEEALREAERAIFDQKDTPNLAERRFWLRQAIAKLLADPEVKWAATQLGALQTAAANEKQQSDYRTAKTLWELSSAGGDSVAACFLAKLYELGLGVTANAIQAKLWYDRAKVMGGCDLKHEAPASALTN